MKTKRRAPGRPGRRAALRAAWLAVCAAVLLMCGAATAEEIASGTCGDDITWSLDDAGVLTVTGTGEMAIDSAGAPWYAHRGDIRRAVIGDGVTGIGAKAFYGCGSMTQVEIPDSVTAIGDFAFQNCTGLASVALPAGLTRVGSYAFYNCSALTELHIASVGSWLGIAFTDEYSHPNRYAQNWFIDNKPLTAVVIPEGVTAIGDYAFRGFSGLRSVTIPDSVTRVGREAFRGCTGVEKVWFPSAASVTILSRAFDGVPQTARFYTADGTYVDGWAANMGYDVVHVDGGGTGFVLTLPEGTTTIGPEAFAGLTSVDAIVLPVSVNSIADSAFNNTDAVLVVPAGSYAETWAEGHEVEHRNGL